MAVTLKVKRPNGEVAVLTFDSQPSWEDFAAEIATSLHVQIGAVRVTYDGTDDDVVTMRSQEDLQLYFMSHYKDNEAGQLSLIEATQAQTQSAIPARAASVEGSKGELAPASDVDLEALESFEEFSSIHPRGPEEELNHYLIRIFSEFIKSNRTSSIYVYSSASELARSRDGWIQWAKGAGLTLPSRLLINETEGVRLNIVMDLKTVARDIKYPPELKQTKVNNFPDLRNVNDFVEGISKWATDNSSKVWAEPSIDGRRPLTDALYQPWSAMREAMLEMSVEMSQRIGADAILQVVFNDQVKDEEDHPLVLLEQTIALPSCSSSISDIVVSSAKADTVVLKNLPEELEWGIMKNLVRKGENRKFLQCIESIDIDARIAIPLFVLESKRLEAPTDIRKVDSIAERQLAMDFSGGQHQRRALHFEDKVMYGATMVDGVFKIFASFWEQNQVATVATSHKWDLKEPAGFVQCFYFLCSLKVHIDESFADDVCVLHIKLTSHAVTTFGETHWKEERRSQDTSRNDSKQLGNTGTKPSGSKRPNSDQGGPSKRPRATEDAGYVDQGDVVYVSDSIEDIEMDGTGGGENVKSSGQDETVGDGHGTVQNDEEFEMRTDSGVDISDDDEQSNSSDTDSHISFSERPQFVVVRNRRRRKAADISAWRSGERHWLDDEGKPPSTEIRRVVYISSSSSR